MPRRIYQIGDLTYEFEEGHQPEGAVEIPRPAPAPAPSPKRRGPVKKNTEE